MCVFKSNDIEACSEVDCLEMIPSRQQEVSKCEHCHFFLCLIILIFYYHSMLPCYF